MKKRRVAIYFAWSRPLEINADLGTLENRYPTLFEFRRALYPVAAALKAVAAQDISGFMDHVILDDFKRFGDVIAEETGVAPPVIQREGARPPVAQLDRDYLSAYDTLVVVSLDHFRTQQVASTAEIEAVRDFLARESACVFICPHHFIGGNATPTAQEEEFGHHGDRLVPPEQTIGGFARSLLAGLGFDVENRFGLNPSVNADGSPSPLVTPSRFGSREPARRRDHLQRPRALATPLRQPGAGRSRLSPGRTTHQPPGAAPSFHQRGPPDF